MLRNALPQSFVATPAVHDASAPSQRQRLRKAIWEDKREGLRIALRARLFALVAVALLLPVVASWPAVLFPELFTLAFAMVGFAQQRFANVESPWIEWFLAGCVIADALLLTLIVVVTNPFEPLQPPLQVHFHYGTFIYFFIFLGGATISLGWRTLLCMALIVPLIWLGGVALVDLTQPVPVTSSAAAAGQFRGPLAALLDPYNVIWTQRVQEAVVFAIVTVMLAANARRAERLLKRFALSERERENLSRYFSPNVVEELAAADEPIGKPRQLSAAVLFVDIVGFTRYAASVPAGEAMATLRSFFARMEKAVFEHRGTLDKYLGDGLMATFGTPEPGDSNALDALRCARAMIASIEAWNAERARGRQPPVKIGLGLHFGEVVLGNIGVDRLEFAVIGDSVNVASRLEGLTRTLGVDLVVSRALLERARSEAPSGDASLEGLAPAGTHPIAGTGGSIEVATL